MSSPARNKTVSIVYDSQKAEKKLVYLTIAEPLA